MTAPRVLLRLVALGAGVLMAGSGAAGAQSRRPQPTPAPPPPTAARGAELARVRQERAALEQRMRSLTSTVRDISADVDNIARQASATSRLVATLDRQLVSIDADVGTTSAQLDRAQRDLDRKQVALQRRLVEIYKRGPLYTAEVMFSAASLGELVTRYKYLHELTLRDRSLVRQVEGLRDDVAGKRAMLLRLQSELARNRAEKADEETRLRALETQRVASLRQARQQASRTQARLAQIARDEARLTSVIAALEAARKRAAVRPPAAARAASATATRGSGAVPAAGAATSASAGASAGALAPNTAGRAGWPVNGSLLYRFGRVVSANNTSTRWNGIGIGAPAGTPVRAVAAGTVVVAETMGSYGLTVIVQHGGDYSIYGSLARTDVRKGATVARGETLGAVGSADPDLPPHLHFEIRPSGRAIDPLPWLGAQR